MNVLQLASSILPSVTSILDKHIPDKDLKAKLEGEIQNSVNKLAETYTSGTIRTNQFEAQHRSVFVAGWRPAIGWSLAAGIFWALIGGPIAEYIAILTGVDAPLPQFPQELVLELTFAMLGMSAIRSFDKLRNLTR